MEESITPVCLLIIAATGVFSYLGFSRYGFIERYLFDIQRILRDRQYYRIFTSALLHGSWTHLIFNMFTLYSFGSAIEKDFGIWQFLLIYVSGILGGNLLSLVLHRNHEYRALGASGGVCGIVFACIFLLPGSSVYLFLIPYPIPAHIYAVGFMLFSYFGLRSQAGNIGHDAHLGGAIVSLLVTTAMYPYIIRENPILYPGVLIMAVAMLLLLYLNPLHLPQAAAKPKIYKPQKEHQEDKTEEPDDEPTDEEILNQLLEKVSKSGIHSLNYIERQKLEMISKRKKQ
ncbi:MAG: rhomboid family intramembrane serine protease [Sedimentisphaerales bacterium]|nr:rhomboid family intramembrane serine protease [Sedimentisphaerales bacterium]